MTQPIPDLSGLIPSKWKAWVALIGTGLTFLVPFILEAQTALPPLWSAAVGLLLWVLTALGVLRAPYLKPGTVVTPETAVKTGGTVVTPAGKVGTKVDGEHTDHVHIDTGLDGYTNPFPPISDQLS